MEVYNLRMSWGRFNKDVQYNKETFSKAIYSAKTFNEDFKTISEVHENILFLAQMCKAQNLNTIGKINPFKELISCSNNLEAFKLAFLEKTLSNKELNNIKSMIENRLDIIAASILNKSLTTIVEHDEEKEENNVFSVLTKDKPKSLETMLYETINEKLELEKSAAKEKINNLDLNEHVVLNGSVAINHFFKERDIKDLEYSLVKFPGIEYTHSRKESITPIHIFHNQILVALNLKQTRFKFGKRVKSNKELSRNRNFSIEEARSEIHKEVNDLYKSNLVDMMYNLQNKYLYAKAFKGVLFFWFTDDKTYKALGRFPENTLSLMWD